MKLFIKESPPSTQLSADSLGVLKKPTAAVSKFNQEFHIIVADTLKTHGAFQAELPIKNRVFAIIIQYFTSSVMANSHDLDNLLKTIFDSLKKSSVIEDDGLIYEIYSAKLIAGLDSGVLNNFLYIGLKKFQDNQLLFSGKTVNTQKIKELYNKLQTISLPSI